MTPSPRPTHTYHIFLASPGDVAAERQYVRKFFDEYNRHTAHIWNARFEVVDWENCATIGVGRPQDLITRQTLEKYRDSLTLVIGIMAQRFGSPTGKSESGTKDEFDWAMESHKATGWPEIKWFFRKIDQFSAPSDLDRIEEALEQWKKVRDFRRRMQDLNNPVFYTEYPGAAKFAEVFDRDLNRWLADPDRPWAAEREAQVDAGGAAATVALPAQFDAGQYRAAVLRQFDTLNFEMLDTTGAFYSGVRLWGVFVPQSARECHQYNPRLFEIPKEHQQRLLDAGEITAEQLEQAQGQADRLRRDYFGQPRRPVLEVIDQALRGGSSSSGRKLVILGDPGSGKSSLIRYLALRWARIAEPAVRDTQPVPLVIELGSYGRWQCEGRKGFIRYLEEGPVWHEWPRGLPKELVGQPGRVVLLLDGLDEIFDLATRDAVINDIQRFSSQFPHTPVVVTSRVVGYQPQRLRDAEFRHFMLQDLDTEQIDAFVHRWHDETFDDAEQAVPKRDRLKKAIRDSKSIALLAGNPLLLTMMAILNRNQELPRDRADLYAQASRVLLHQWDTERTLKDFPGTSDHVGWREKTDILRRVAAHMQSGPGGLTGNMIDGPALTGLIEDYLRDELRFAQSRAVARALVEQLRQRNFILCFVGADSYGFVHRTFLEYFCAADIVHQFNVAKTLDEKGLIALFDEHCRDDDWREVLRLICGQIDEQFAGRIVEHLATRADLDKWDGRTPLPELPLAVYCLSELRSLSRIEDAGSRLMQQTIRVATKAEIQAIQFLMNEFLPACRELGTRWPGKDQLKKLTLSQLDHFREIGSGLHFWPYLVAQVTANREAVRELTHTARGKWVELTRGAALGALAEKWPDQTTRELLAQRAVQDEDRYPRGAALQALAEQWPDQTTRELLEQRAVEDDDAYPRGAALEALAEKWPDETTRDLLAQRAVQDKDRLPRHAVLRALADKWPDQTTRELLAQRAVQDEDGSPRGAALRALAAKWPDQTTRDLLEQRSVQDDHQYSRGAALEALVAKWPDETTRELLAEWAVDAPHSDVRRAALEALAEQWPDQTTRELLEQRAVEDDDAYPRGAALEALAEKWPDQTTRELLTQRAVQDDDEYPRHTALQALAEKWPNETTRTARTAGRPG